MAPQQHHESLHREGRMALAIQALETGYCQNPTAAASSYDVYRRTLKRRIAGILPQHGSRAYNRLLTINEEETLVQ
jgi:hypothetical protein